MTCDTRALGCRATVPRPPFSFVPPARLCSCDSGLAFEDAGRRSHRRGLFVWRRAVSTGIGPGGFSRGGLGLTLDEMVLSTLSATGLRSCSSLLFVPTPCLTPGPRHELRRTQVTSARLSTFVARRAHALRRAGRVCSMPLLCLLITAVACRVKRTRGPIWGGDFCSKASVLML